MQNTLPINKKEALIYTFLMVVVMASGMTFLIWPITTDLIPTL